MLDGAASFAYAGAASSGADAAFDGSVSPAPCVCRSRRNIQQRNTVFDGLAEFADAGVALAGTGVT